MSTAAKAGAPNQAALAQKIDTGTPAAAPAATSPDEPAFWLYVSIVALSLSGVAAALWQHFVAAASDSCKLTLAERIISGLGLDGSLPEIFQPRASCADAAVKLLGLHYEFWSLMLFVLLDGWNLVVGSLVQGLR